MRKESETDVLQGPAFQFICKNVREDPDEMVEGVQRREAAMGGREVRGNPESVAAASLRPVKLELVTVSAMAFVVVASTSSRKLETELDEMESERSEEPEPPKRRVACTPVPLARLMVAVDVCVKSVVFRSVDSDTDERERVSDTGDTGEEDATPFTAKGALLYTDDRAKLDVVEVVGEVTVMLESVMVHGKEHPFWEDDADTVTTVSRSVNEETETGYTPALDPMAAKDDNVMEDETRLACADV